jgi:hypothetical protein
MERRRRGRAFDPEILTVKHDVIPLDGTDVLQQGEIDSVGDWATLAEDSRDLPRPARKALGSFGGTLTTQKPGRPKELRSWRSPRRC